MEHHGPSMADGVTQENGQSVLSPVEEESRLGPEPVLTLLLLTVVPPVPVKALNLKIAT